MSQKLSKDSTAWELELCLSWELKWNQRCLLQEDLQRELATNFWPSGQLQTLFLWRISERNLNYRYEVKCVLYSECQRERKWLLVFKQSDAKNKSKVLAVWVTKLDQI